MKLDSRNARCFARKPSANALEYSENDSLRSNFLRKFLQVASASSTKVSNDAGCIPKVVFQFWDEIDIPSDVQDCINSWKTLETKGIQHRLFSSISARKFIFDNLLEDNVKAFDRCYHPAMKSDYFRLCFMYCRGGFYVDVDDVYSGADVSGFFSDPRLKLQPLCFDIDANSMVCSEELVFKCEFSESRIFYFNNNPIIAPPLNPTIAYALQRSTNLILGYEEDAFPEIQSTAGPGNMSASVVACLSDYPRDGQENHLSVLFDWEKFARTKWELSYRNDGRNWRLSNRKRYARSKPAKEQG